MYAPTKDLSVKYEPMKKKANKGVRAMKHTVKVKVGVHIVAEVYQATMALVAAEEP